MRTRSLAAGVLVSSGLALAFVQDPQPVRTPAAEVLQRAFELAETVPEHAYLARLVGSFEVVVRTHTPDGAAREPAVQEQRGNVVGQAMLGGRYVALRCRLELGGRAVEALQILGFDKLQGVYTSSWRDDRSTWSVECRGAPDEQEPLLLQLNGTLADARDPGGRPFRLELDLRDQQRLVVRVFERHDGREVLVQEQLLTPA